MIQPREDVALMPGYHSPQIDVVTRLNTNESPYLPPQKFIEESKELMSSLAWNRYPDRSVTKLRTALARLHDKEQQFVEITANNIFVANGSNEVLHTLLSAYGGPGRKVLVFEPTYALHSHIAKLVGTEVVSEPRESNFLLSIPYVSACIEKHRPDIVFLCTPNNPTGIIESKELVESTIAQMQTLGGLVIVDEAYVQFSTWNALSIFQEDIPLVITRTFSKTWSMAAARLGYAIGPNEIIESCEKVVLPYHLDAIKQLVGEQVLQYQDEMEMAVAQIIQQREKIIFALQQLGIHVFPSGSNFVLFQMSEIHLSAKQVWDELVQKSILIRDCSTWPSLEGCLRVTVGNPEENEHFLDAMKEIMQ